MFLSVLFVSVSERLDTAVRVINGYAGAVDK